MEYNFDLKDRSDLNLVKLNDPDWFRKRQRGREELRREGSPAGQESARRNGGPTRHDEVAFGPPAFSRELSPQPLDKQFLMRLAAIGAQHIAEGARFRRLESGNPGQARRYRAVGGAAIGQ